MHARLKARIRAAARMKLSTRIALAVAVAVPVLVLAAAWLLLQLVTRDAHAQQDALLAQRAAQVADEARGLLRAAAKDRSAAVERARERRLYASALDVGIRLSGPDGTVSGGPQPSASVALPAVAPEPVSVADAHGSWRVLAVPVRGTRAGVEGTLWLFSPDSTGQQQVALVRRRVVTVALLAAPVSGLLGLAIASGASRPLRRLQRRTSGLDPEAGPARLEHARTGVTEVDDLARTVQTVLARYDEQAARASDALATARSFAAAASHELRTPLMSMQTNLEVLSGHPGLGPAERAEVLDDLRTEHTRMLGLLVMLRELGRGDLVEADAFGEVDLTEVIDASVAEAARRHPTAEIAVRTSSGPGVYGWEPGLRTVVDNLLANALVHGRGADGRASIEVGLRVESGGTNPVAVLTVDDRGPGVPRARRDEVFERFRRGPDSPGSGLGLTLVAQQAALHHGQARVLDPPSGAGARFEVRLPLHGDAGSALPAERDWLIGTARPPQGFHKVRS
ncbi:HAMP domain-containing sensor histidine kinase [Streptomyces sp. NPDC019396]|uniref:sensor histidine kinase n=1 Tax=Streptomyces sp. NPDC019396 TaxID=3154687 RepID=UPI0033CBCDBD